MSAEDEAARAAASERRNAEGKAAAREVYSAVAALCGAAPSPAEPTASFADVAYGFPLLVEGMKALAARVAALEGQGGGDRGE